MQNSERGLSHDELARLLAPYGQQHLLQFWGELNEIEQTQLASQIRAIDFAAITKLFRSTSSGAGGDNWSELARRAEPPPAFRLDGRGNPFSVAAAIAAGEQALRRGEVGAILVAGGQGSRLGFDHPKGMYPIGPISNASLFQILLEKLVAVGRRYGAPAPLYVMTSPATHDETVAYFSVQQRFGLAAENVHFFCQGQMPAVDAASGRALLAKKGQLALSPDGHGGMLAALARSGGLDDIRRRGIKQLFYFQVDNPLVAVCDPLFIGYHILSRSEMSMLAISKRDPAERVGNVVRIDGRSRVIEYSDFPLDVAEQRNADGSLRFWAGSIAIHVFDAEFLQRCGRDNAQLAFHVARKKVAYIDERGQTIEPSQPNALKFERFIFDLLPAADRAIVVETDAAQTFAAVKNEPGAPSESRDTCQAAMIALHRRWLEAAGAKIAANVPVEISPLFALDAEAVRAKIKQPITIDKPTYFGTD